ncbi:myoD family inhibitor domain-containing protein-like [Phyllopteryx taeniolatus]|uniref:myoD family inhibitor domain-containing protein-like n=1 Tax=Phyllopteryx taeniolatus TaxID=161469 RepID=UPI002AD44A21|nr:myoD family inhibitor domain-containing protein-like [Phyllopteryx taeniolatus]
MMNVMQIKVILFWCIPGSMPFKLKGEVPPVTMPTELINTQPQRGATLPQGNATVPDPPRHVTRTPACPRCGLAVPNDLAGSRGTSQGRGSSLSVQSGNVADSNQRVATPSDSCAHLLLACLSCQCSTLLLALLEACTSGLHDLCACCCGACARCCQVLREAPVEEFNCHAHCHSVLFQSCGEPTECLEFCMECCQICHHN